MVPNQQNSLFSERQKTHPGRFNTGRVLRWLGPELSKTLIISLNLLLALSNLIRASREVVGIACAKHQPFSTGDFSRSGSIGLEYQKPRVNIVGQSVPGRSCCPAEFCYGCFVGSGDFELS